ncbi:MAG: DUF655 domain-containing protein [Candidatus Methanomethylophilaceae archaeon]
MEEYAFVLDYLPQGLPSNNYSKRDPVCYAIGEEEFKLFELVPKPNAQIMIDDRVYIGKDPALRTQVDHVKRRIGYEELTNTANGELEFIITQIVTNNQARFVKFYNEAGPISIKKHLLEELPGLGKKTMQEILKERDKGKFVSFNDLATRVPLLKGPEKLIVSRIILEISDPERRRYLFISR